MLEIEKEKKKIINYYKLKRIIFRIFDLFTPFLNKIRIEILI